MSPTVSKLFLKLRDRINFNGGSTSLRNIVKELGFLWKKMKNNRVVLIKKHDMRCMRVSYLTALNKYREEGCPIAYKDETYVHSSHTALRTGVMIVHRVIILHAGGCCGFIPNALVIFKSNQKTGNYHNEMNSKNYICWLKQKLIPNLELNSVLVTDNAPLS
jgi:hypothetical protein